IAILKGAGTLIASENDCAVSTTGNPGMASGGMGDVLAGVIAGLLAQGLSLKNAAQQGVYSHGQAADLAAEKDGERGLLASDLMPYLRRGL
ncbi:MAG: bifunctional ADP-dependent NAD(P)H-hydrate dehydratase/NAD(P)H-hydrate epimerase, partial [Methylococcaceae bacterium]|nr:bifunctional ADP-dependent NAD(P)H-hydrate dehydratase/NAD(P)H-hydrate epimerase [Methylococcaceae bacterium]